MIISGKVHRTIAVILGSVLMIGLGILEEQDALRYIHWEALGLIFGMFVLIAALSKSGFFRWIGLHALHATKFDAFKIFLFFSLLSAFFAAFMDSITVLIFMASLTIEVCIILRIPSIPFLIAEITSANIGGSATMVGDPPNIIIGTAFNYSFADFVVNTGPIAIVVFLVNLLFFYLWHKRIFVRREEDLEEIYREHKDLEPFSAIQDLRLMRTSLVIFVFTVTLLILHQLLDLFVAFVGILGASLVLIFGGREMPELVEKIDWHTILFLAGLFIMVGGLEKTGVLSDVARGILSTSSGNAILLVSIILWTSAIFSAFLDNIPFAAAMIPVIREISQASSPSLQTLSWTLALGTDVGGNATPIGASANVVGLAVAEKHAVHISWKDYCKVAFPAMLVCMAVINLLLFLLYLR